jgi:hypothetical protein
MSEVRQTGLLFSLQDGGKQVRHLPEHDSCCPTMLYHPELICCDLVRESGFAKKIPFHFFRNSEIHSRGIGKRIPCLWRNHLKLLDAPKASPPRGGSLTGISEKHRTAPPCPGGAFRRGTLVKIRLSFPIFIVPA